MHFKIRITLNNENVKDGHGFGRGIEMLLSGIENNGSLNRTAKNMGMAYSKAWRILKQAETEFGMPLVLRDGARGSTLTDEGREFLAHYREMLSAAEVAAGNVFDKYFER